MHPAQQVAVGDSGGYEENVVTGDQIVDVQNPIEIVTGVQGSLPFLVLTWP